MPEVRKKFTVRLSDDELKRAYNGARFAGCSVAEFVRQQLMKHASPCEYEGAASFNYKGVGISRDLMYRYRRVAGGMTHIIVPPGHILEGLGSHGIDLAAHLMSLAEGLPLFIAYEWLYVLPPVGKDRTHLWWNEIRLRDFYDLIGKRYPSS